MAEIADLCFLFDVDNTLLDNDRIAQDLSDYLEKEYGQFAHDCYWTIFEDVRRELGYADYLGALERYRVKFLHDPRILRMANWLIDYPFAKEHRMIMDFLKANGIDALDLAPYFSKYKTPMDLWVASDDAHPNRQANRLFAEYMFDFVKKRLF